MNNKRHSWAGLFGTPPIHPALFLIAKLTLLGVVLLPLLQLAGIRLQAPVPGATPVACVLALAAVVLLVLGSRALGGSLRVGLPTESTELKTSGVYRFSRHPLYLALFLAAIASGLYCPHPVVLSSAAVTILLHHRIALAEECFLGCRFGEAWQRYRAHVPRYLGWPGRLR